MDRLIEDKIWGQINFPWEVEHLLDTPTLSRLKKIQQGGLTNQVYPHIQTTRYEHSIGVYHLLRHFGASPVQQIAGLLHDISHTAFSHVSDYLFDQTEEDYHEKFFAEFMTREDIQQALAKLAINKDEILNGDFPLLNAPLPHLSADRLDYTLRDLSLIHI